MAAATINLVAYPAGFKDEARFFTIDAGTVQYVKVEGKSAGLELEIKIADEPPRTWRSPQPNLQKELLVFGPYNNHASVKIALPRDQHPILSEPIRLDKSIPLPPIESSEHDQLESYATNLEKIVDDNSVPLFVRNSIRLAVGHRLIEAGEIQQAAEIARINTRDWIYDLNLQCELFASANRTGIEAVSLEARANALENLVELAKDTTNSSYHSPWLSKCLTELVPGNGSRSIESITAQLAELLLLKVDDATEDRLKAAVLGKIWIHLNRQDQHEAANKLIRRAITFASIDEPLKLHLQQYHSTTLIRLGKYFEAQQVLTAALNSTVPMSSVQREIFLFNKGYIFRKMGEHDTSRRYFEQALTDYQEKTSSCLGVKHVRNAATILTQMGATLREAGDVQTAENYFLCALEILGQNKFFYELSAQIEYAKNLITTQEYDKAIGFASRVLEDTRAEEPHQIDARLILLDALLSTDRKTQASSNALELANTLGFSGIDRAARLVDPLRYVNPSLKYALQKVEFFSLLIRMCGINADITCERGFFNNARAILLQYEDRISFPLAWNASRYALTINYVEKLIEKRVAENTDNNQAAVDAAIHHALETTYAIDLHRPSPLGILDKGPGFKEWMSAEENATLNSETLDAILSAKLDQLRDSLISTSAPSARDVSPRRFIPLDELVASISEDELLLRYFFGKKYAFVMSISKDDVELTMFPTDIGHQGDLSAASDIKLDTWTQLIPSAVIKSTHRKIVLIPDHTFHRVPFSAVNMATDGSYHPLASQASIVRTHSFSDYFNQDLLQKETSFSTIAIFASAFTETASSSVNTSGARGISIAKIPGALLEAKLISRTFPSKDVILGTGDAATLQFLESEQVRDSTILHIATHGLYNPKHPEFVGLMVAPSDGSTGARVATLNHILTQKYASNLVVISGCDTMLGKHYRGSGLRSLSRGFLKNGAGSVLGTLWPISDLATTKFMDSFYQQLRETGNVSQALQNTRNLTRKSVRYRNPKYWAGFVLTSSHVGFEEIRIRPD